MHSLTQEACGATVQAEMRHGMPGRDLSGSKWELGKKGRTPRCGSDLHLPVIGECAAFSLQVLSLLSWTEAT